VLELEIAGAQQLTLVKDVQKDPVHQIIEHIDLLVVKKGEKVQVDVPVVVVGEPFAGTIATSTTRPCRSRSRPRTSPRTSRSTSRASRTARTSPPPT
jgi:hypothetical protein